MFEIRGVSLNFNIFS